MPDLFARPYRRDPPDRARACPWCGNIIRTCCDSVVGLTHQLRCSVSEVSEVAEARHEALLWKAA